MVDGEPQEVKRHLVEIVLPRNYPRNTPQCRMLSPVFHPNIAPHAICVGDHWSSGEPLASIVTRIGELLAYQVYNVKSPLNGEAARWVEQNQDKLPLDSVSLLVEEDAAPPNVPPVSISLNAEKTAANGTASTESFQAPSVAQSQSVESVACPSCQKRYRLREEMFGRNLRCVKCDNVFQLPAK
jgi:hypothetical protein